MTAAMTVTIAPAAFFVADHQDAAARLKLHSAVTSAAPQWAALSMLPVRDKCQDGHSAEPLTSQIDKWLTTVQALRAASGPSAILRAVRAVVVNAVDGVPWRRFTSHIRDKVIEIFPTLAHANPSAAVVRIISALWITAPSSNIAPRDVFGTPLPVQWRLAVLHASFNQLFSTQATTTTCVAISQTLADNRDAQSAVASTPIVQARGQPRRFSQHKQSPKPKSNHWSFLMHGPILSQVMTAHKRGFRW